MLYAHLSNLLVTHAVCTVVVYLVVKLSNFYGAVSVPHLCVRIPCRAFLSLLAAPPVVQSQLSNIRITS